MTLHTVQLIEISQCSAWLWRDVPVLHEVIVQYVPLEIGG